MVSPRAWAVLRLMTSSKVVGRSMARLPGLGPLQDLVHIDGRTLDEFSTAIAKGHEAPRLGRFPPRAHGGELVCGGKVYDPLEVPVRQPILAKAERMGPMLEDGGKGAAELIGMAHRHRLQLQSEGPGIRLQLGELERKGRIGRIEEERDAGDLRHRFLQELQAFAREPDGIGFYPRDVAAGLRQARDEPLIHQHGGACRHDRHRRGRLLRRP